MTKSETEKTNNLSVVRIIIKGLLLFIIIDIVFVFIHPLPAISKLSFYNYLFPGRVRLPYGEVPDQAYNLSVYSLDAMFASHEISAPTKSSNEYRVILVGDSSVWGYLLKPNDMLSAQLNSNNLKLKDGREIRAYNLGYPTLSLMKDLVILNDAFDYSPDLIVWLVTLESFPRDKQFDSPIVKNNPEVIQTLLSAYSLNLDPQDTRLVTPNFWDSTLIGERRSIVDLIRLQLYGVMWAATGIDQYYPTSYDPPQENLSSDKSFHNLLPPTLSPGDLSMDILSAGIRIAGKVPVIFVNEPIYLSQGENSDIRYNFFYPRWAYDQFRQLFSDMCASENWRCLDEWNLVPPGEFTNSAIHMTPAGTAMLAQEIEKAILSLSIP
jgi:hypothetical protein